MADVDTAAPVVDQAPAVPAPTGDTKSEPATAAADTPGGSAADEAPVATLTEEQQKSWTNLPPEARKHFNRLYTQKTQELSAQKKEHENAVALVEALKDESRRGTTLEFIAKSLGYQVSKPEIPAAQQAKDEIFTQLSEQFGEPAAQVILKAAEQIAEKKVEPIQSARQQETQAAMARENKAIEEAFAAKHPDWKQYESRMTEIGQILRPGPGADKTAYIEHLYFLARRDGSEAQVVKEVAERMAKSAQSAEAPTSGISATRVAATIPTTGSFQERFKAAAELAKRGQVVER